MTSKSMEKTLHKTLNDIQIRSKVENVVRGMVADVEIANRLEEKLQTRSVVNALQNRIQEQEDALEEARALQKRNRSIQASLADKVVKELWSLSRELGDLQAIKSEHDVLLVQYDEVIAKLIATEDKLEEARRGAKTSPSFSFSNANAAEHPQTQSQQHHSPAVAHVEAPATSAATATSTDNDDTVAVTAEQHENKPTVLPASDEYLTSSNRVVVEEAGTGTKADEQKVVDDTTKPAAAATASQAEEERQQPAVIVELDDEDGSDVDGDKSPTFEDLDTTVIMHIFSFLDALDILNTAQVNVSMYSRVDSLFGLGPQSNEEEIAEDNSTIATEVTAPSTVQPSVTTTSSTTAGASSASTSNATAAAATTASPKPRSTTAANVPPPSTPKSGTVAHTSTTPTKSAVGTTTASNVPGTATPAAAAAAAAATRFDGPRALFTSLLQPRKQTTPTSSPSSPSKTYHQHHKRSASSDGAQPQHQPMNAAMANSMAAKLTDAELNAILIMTERLRQKEALADRLVKENEELLAKVDSGDAISEFLTARVTQMEQSLKNSEDDGAKVAQQIASDQEVIAFLDGRVQELEGDVRRLESDKATALEELARVREQAEQKSVVMGDMLQFERQRLSECERDWKSAKKLLIKEVKNCRAQVIALQAERDGYREQNEILRKAVMLSPGSAATSTMNGIGGVPARFHS